MYHDARTSAASRGVGGLLAAEYPLTPEVSLHRRRRHHGQPQRPLARGRSRRANPNNNVDPLFGSSYIQHLHAGFIRKTDVHAEGDAALDDQLGAGRPRRSTTSTETR